METTYCTKLDCVADSLVNTTLNLQKHLKQESVMLRRFYISHVNPQSQLHNSPNNSKFAFAKM